VGDIDLKVISATENSNKFQETRFWKEKSVEDVVTLGPTAQAALVIMKLRCHGHQSRDTFKMMTSTRGEKRSLLFYLLFRSQLLHCLMVHYVGC
jgi:hypothetical protein